MLVTETNRAEWLAKRRESIGASEAYDVLARPLTLYLRKLGLIEDDELNEAMRVGLFMEPYLKSRFQEETSQKVVQDQVWERHGSHPEITATADGLTLDGDLVEYKTIDKDRARKDLGPSGSDVIPERWTAQAYVQMAVHETGRVWFAVLVGGNDFRLYEVERREVAIDLLIDRVSGFWHDHITPRIPPRADLADLDALRRIVPEPTEIPLGMAADALIDQYHELKALAKRYGAEADAIQAQLRGMLLTAELGRTPMGRELRLQRIERREHKVKASTFYKFAIKEPKTEEVSA